MANRSTASLLTAEQSGTLAGQSDSRTRSGREHCPGQRRGRCPAGSDEADDLAWDEIRLQFLKLTRIASLDVVKPLGFFVHREKATDRGWPQSSWSWLMEWTLVIGQNPQTFTKGCKLSHGSRQPSRDFTARGLHMVT